MKYYAIGEKKFKVKDENGKEQSVLKTVVITEIVANSRPWNQRHVAQNEAAHYCRVNHVNLQGVYLAKIASDANGFMTKNIKGQKAKKHQDHLRRRAAKSG